MSMLNSTRLRFNAYQERIAELNGVPPEFVTTGHEFEVNPDIQRKAFARLSDPRAREDLQFAAGAAPTTEQRLVQRRMDTIAFLSMINVIGVRDLTGMPVGMTMSGMAAGRTDTTVSGQFRRGTLPMSLDNFPYQLAQTNFDITIPYALVDEWSKFDNFETMMRDELLILQGLNRISVGWNGTHAAATTDPVAHPLGQDVNTGWLAQIAANMPDAYMTGGATAGTIKVGTNASNAASSDFASLDALAWGMKEKMLPVWYRDDPELVCIVGAGLIYEKFNPIINQQQDSLNTLAMQQLMAQASNARFGGIPAVRVPFFPSNAMCITKLRNLSLYWQMGRNRRLIQDAPWANGVNDWQSGNEGYVIEDPHGICAATNIVMADTADVAGPDVPPITG